MSADGDLGGGDSDDEEHQHLPVVVRQPLGCEVEAREGYQRQVRCAEHQLEAHEDDDDVAAQQHPCEADCEEQSADEEVFVEANHDLFCSAPAEDDDADSGDEQEHADHL